MRPIHLTQGFVKGEALFSFCDLTGTLEHGTQRVVPMTNMLK